MANPYALQNVLRAEERRKAVAVGKLREAHAYARRYKGGAINAVADMIEEALAELGASA